MEYTTSHRLASSLEVQRSFLRNVIDKCFELLPKGKIKILDSGCGDGLFSVVLKEYFPDAEIISIDLDDNSLKDAKTKGLTVIKADLQKNLPFDDDFFDLIVSNQVIEHLLNPDIYLLENKRVLKKSGVLLLTTPNLAAWFNRIIFLFGVQPFFYETSTVDKTVGLSFTRSLTPMREPMQHIRVFTAGALTDITQLHGMKVVKKIGLPIHYFPKIVRFFDYFISKIPSLAANLEVIIKK